MSCHHGHDHVHHHHANLEVKVSNNFTKCYFWDWEVSWKLCLKVCTYGKVKKAEKLQTLQSLRSHVENQCHQFLWPWVIFRRKWHRSPCLWQKLECRPAGMIKKNVLLFNYYTSKEGFWFFFFNCRGCHGEKSWKPLVRLKNTALLYFWQGSSFIKETLESTYLAIFEGQDHVQFLFYPHFCSQKGKCQFQYQGLVPRKIL